MRNLHEILADEIAVSHPIIEPDFDEFEPTELVAMLAKEEQYEV